jgi:predicted phosphodiesterase
MVKCRIISDLHYTKGINGPDWNGTYKTSNLWKNFSKDFQEPVDITLIAGDIAAGIDDHKEFFESFFPNQKVIFIDGNHICYTYTKDNKHPILSELKQELKKEFPIKHLFWRYLENDWCWIDENTAVIGSTFYTDYNYCDLTLEEFNEKLQAWHLWTRLYGLPSKYEPVTKLTKQIIRNETMAEACSRMNDFKWGKENNRFYLSPEYYFKLHKLAKKEVKRCHNEIIDLNPNAKIILMTHHCLSPKCISEKYKKGLLNASYTSDLEKWIDKELPGVKLVISGHVHNRCDFTFGKRNIHYIVNPCGYIPYNEPFNKPKFNPNLIIDTDLDL